MVLFDETYLMGLLYIAIGSIAVKVIGYLINKYGEEVDV